MKYLMFFIALLLAQQSYCQASSQSEFQLKLSFTDQIKVEELEPHYFSKSGNRFEKINYTKNSSDNSITIYGENEYILWVSFPTLVFTLKETTPTDTTHEKTTLFYLYSKGPLSSYTGTQHLEIKFSYKKPIIIASLKKHNQDDAFKKLKIEKTNQVTVNDFYIGNEMIKIYE